MNSMTTKSKFATWLSAIFFISITTANAQIGSNSNYYFGAEYTYNKINSGITSLTSNLNEKDNGYKIFGGYKFNPYLATELSYNDFGQVLITGKAGQQFKYNGSTYTWTRTANEAIQGTSWGLALKPSFPINENISLVGTLGLHNYETQGDATNNSGTRPFYGAGILGKYNNLIIGLEYNYYKFDSADKYAFKDVKSLGLRASYVIDGEQKSKDIGYSKSNNFDKGTFYGGLGYHKYNEPTAVIEDQSRAPEISVGFKDERAIRGVKSNDLNLGYNLEATYGLIAYDGSGFLNYDYYKIQGEIYHPIYEKFYAGLGYRYHYSNEGGKTTSIGLTGYDRRDIYYYLPVGYNVSFNNSDNLKLQYNYFIKGKQTSWLSTGTLNFDQKKGYGLEAIYTPKESKFEYYLKRWSIENSTTNQGYVEPQNSTTEFGIRYAF
jgi:OOP family OmpA-OmpF porin